MINLIYQSFSNDENEFIEKNMTFYWSYSNEFNLNKFNQIKEFYSINFEQNFEYTMYDLYSNLTTFSYEGTLSQIDIFKLFQNIYIMNDNNVPKEFMAQKEILVQNCDYFWSFALFEETNIDKLYHFLRLTYLNYEKRDSEEFLLHQFKHDLLSEKELFLDTFTLDMAKIGDSMDEDKENALKNQCFDKIISTVEKRLLELNLNSDLDNSFMLKAKNKIKL